MPAPAIRQEIRVFVEGGEEAQKVKIEHVEIQSSSVSGVEGLKTQDNVKLLGKIVIRKEELPGLIKSLQEVVTKGAATYNGVPQIVIHQKAPRDDLNLALENEEASATLKEITQRAAQRVADQAVKGKKPRAIASEASPPKQNMKSMPPTKPGMRRLKQAPPPDNAPTPLQEEFIGESGEGHDGN